ncbi:hypothetical protein PIB30_032795 [Stylosanthes scabra]|uniref:Uncharacterized protein n=1 Tax=Stylosanthes scabra TaxID=79078 RepID=A0ABU6WAL8_9FABA|nr:hypothetical protein [Stylosanthes scabra]
MGKKGEDAKRCCWGIGGAPNPPGHRYGKPGPVLSHISNFRRDLDGLVNGGTRTSCFSIGRGLSTTLKKSSCPQLNFTFLYEQL